MQKSSILEFPVSPAQASIELISEQEYVERCVEYARSAGWLKKNQTELYIKKYFQPLYRQALDILAAVKGSGLRGGEEWTKIVRKLNYCLDATKKIGSTDYLNILKVVDSYGRTARTEAEIYAMDSFYEFTDSLLVE